MYCPSCGKELVELHRTFAAAVARGFKKYVLELLHGLQINVGLVVIQKGDLRPQCGKTISLTTDPDTGVGQ
ncbi:hypothetical protein CHARACLAT_032039 [Characodon lateralis]|uniref:Uncharacterized protein n=1 Tax=Characodon lateralis TaxID=208331 RepID=A0ABU7DNW6_9TELE|nr:hypothetical protein [Characodon lateralis]